MLDIKETYHSFLVSDPDITKPIAAIQSLVALLAEVQPETSAELLTVLQQASDTLKTSVKDSIPLYAGCDLFLRFVLRNIDVYKDWDACKRNLVENGRLFAERAKASRSRIAALALPFIRDHAILLVHGKSRAVISLLLLAASKHIRFSVYVTEARVCQEGVYMADLLRKAGIPVCLIPDCAVAFVINKVDQVFLGAAGVAESGGVINQIGSCQVAMLAHALHKPVYILAESHKFVRLYPLGPSDIPNIYTGEFTTELTDFDASQFAQIDFTPHQYITALVTDLGVLTPSAVSEELIKIWFD